ncbi:hypothetical protein [uncultured Enterovirga sp.]|uniref:hypothetical protein n=1 Tax=uncultured Enterovirga sp. TaxID=2026352 RepID=UPI0035CC0555
MVEQAPVGTWAPIDAVDASPCGVGIVPTGDGEKVALTLREGWAGRASYWMEARTALQLGKELLAAAEHILASGSDKPPQVN